MDRESDSLESRASSKDHIEEIKKILHKLSDYADYLAFRTVEHLIGTDEEMSNFVDSVLKRPKSRPMMLTPEIENDETENDSLTTGASESTQFDSVCCETYYQDQNSFVRRIFRKKKVRWSILTTTVFIGLWTLRRRT